MLNIQRCKRVLGLNHSTHICWTRYASASCTGFNHKELTPTLKHDIERHWKHNLGAAAFDTTSTAPKKYVLSMFPYPSGNLHMGHVRVYTISDAMARFYRMQGYNVLHPMGWDAFGLPAENAAIERNIAADQWTQTNMQQMKERFDSLGCSFDWSRELATCDPKYYKWTQWLFLQMFKRGMAYQKEAVVNWDPVDKTVLADEQVDANGCSWRSGAKVEKKLLKQWFVKTTAFAKSLLDGLDDPSLEDWRDIIKLQKHWIGECNGYAFDLRVEYGDRSSAEGSPSSTAARLKTVTLWTDRPSDLKAAAFVLVKQDHVLAKVAGQKAGRLSVYVKNPFNGDALLPVIVSNDVEFAVGCDTYLGVPGRREEDLMLAEQHKINTENVALGDVASTKEVLDLAQQLNIGGFPVSSKLKDWLISRQRKWGTPIPIVHCPECGPMPYAEESLPVQLNAPLQTACPSCGNNTAHRDTDTMDTFVDSSWYFLRYTDAQNAAAIFDTARAAQLAPVDLYVGGKEHAVLHLYYARFVSHFLHHIGLVAQPEPFKRLLVQGMVMGRSYRVKGSGKYLTANEVRVVNAKKNQAEEVASGDAVTMLWEKMSKSKHNGVEPMEIIGEVGTDTLRLIMLADVAPTSHRNWSDATFPGIINWQKRLWLTMQDFYAIRSNTLDMAVDLTSDEFTTEDAKMYDARNYFLKEATFNYQYSHQLSVAISKMQGLTNAIRRAPKGIVKYGAQYERALAALIRLMAPIAPHFASELWSQFVAVPNRVCAEPSSDIDWERDVMQQRWPIVDDDYKLDLIFKVNGTDVGVGKYKKGELATLTAERALQVALQNDGVQQATVNLDLVPTAFNLYPDCEAILRLTTKRRIADDPRLSVEVADASRKTQQHVQ